MAGKNQEPSASFSSSLKFDWLRYVVARFARRVFLVVLVVMTSLKVLFRQMEKLHYFPSGCVQALDELAGEVRNILELRIPEFLGSNGPYINDVLSKS